MANERIVVKLLYIFDLSHSHTGLAGKGPTRVMLVYDKEKGERRFTVLSKHVPPHRAGEIEAWLEGNLGRGTEWESDIHEGLVPAGCVPWTPALAVNE